MALSPQEIRDAAFKTVKRGGLDPDEVTAFKLAAADALQTALQNATAMEARARAAVAKLQELSQQAAAPATDSAPATEMAATEPAPPAPVAMEPVAAEPEPMAPREPTVDESETISRTLLLAPRSADAAIAEARQEASDIIEAAKADSRRAGEAERVRVEGEVQALLARRDFLESDVDQLEQHLDAQRERITEVVGELEALTHRVPNGLASMRRPQLSASDHAEPDPATEDDDDDVDVDELIDEVVDPDQSAELSRIDTIDVPEDVPQDRADEGGSDTLFQPDDR